MKSSPYSSKVMLCFWGLSLSWTAAKACRAQSCICGMMAACGSMQHEPGSTNEPLAAPCRLRLAQRDAAAMIMIPGCQRLAILRSLQLREAHVVHPDENKCRDCPYVGEPGRSCGGSMTRATWSCSAGNVLDFMNNISHGQIYAAYLYVDSDTHLLLQLLHCQLVAVFEGSIVLKLDLNGIICEVGRSAVHSQLSLTQASCPWHLPSGGLGLPPSGKHDSCMRSGRVNVSHGLSSNLH